MPTATEIIDMFANFQKAIGREVGELMGTIIDASTPRGLPVDANTQTAQMPDMPAFESRIMASIDARIAALESRLQSVAGRKRSRDPSPPTSDVEDTDTEDNEAGSGAVAAAAQQCFAPTKGQTTLTRFIQDAKAMADLVGAVKKLEMTEIAPAPTPMKDESEEEEETDSKDDAEEEEVEETSQQSDDADEEEEEELTQITYKGKDYGMDSNGNIYGMDADGDLIEEPVGKMDEKTKKISFF